MKDIWTFKSLGIYDFREEIKYAGSYEILISSVHPTNPAEINITAINTTITLKLQNKNIWKSL